MQPIGGIGTQVSAGLQILENTHASNRSVCEPSPRAGEPGRNPFWNDPAGWHRSASAPARAAGSLTRESGSPGCSGDGYYLSRHRRRDVCFLCCRDRSNRHNSARGLAGRGEAAGCGHLHLLSLPPGRDSGHPFIRAACNYGGCGLAGTGGPIEFYGHRVWCGSADERQPDPWRTATDGGQAPHFRVLDNTPGTRRQTAPRHRPRRFWAYSLSASAAARHRPMWRAHRRPA